MQQYPVMLVSSILCRNGMGATELGEHGLNVFFKHVNYFSVLVKI